MEVGCRGEVLAAAAAIVEARGRNEFTPQEVISYLKDKGTSYKDDTIRNHVTSRMCINAPKHYAVTYEDFERVFWGIYRIIGL
jgi:hypothetical protein